MTEEASPPAGVRASVEIFAWPPRRWLVVSLAAGVTAILTGGPTDLLPNGIFQRMTPVVWWDYPIWAATSLLMGLIAGTYVSASPSVKAGKQAGRSVAASVVSLFAVGCPICNKLIVAALGVSGALSYFGPAQPFLGVASVLLLLGTLVVRLRAQKACPVLSRSTQVPGPPS